MLHIVAVILGMRNNAPKVHSQGIRPVANAVQILAYTMEPHHALYLGGLHELLQAIADAVTSGEYPALMYNGAATKVATTTHQTNHEWHFMAFRHAAANDLGIPHRAGHTSNYYLEDTLPNIIFNVF